MEVNPNQDTDSEQFVDMPGLEDVRPANLPTAGIAEEEVAGEPEPDYGQIRDDAGPEHMFGHEKPSLGEGLLPDRDELETRAVRTGNAAEEDAHPPYEFSQQEEGSRLHFPGAFLFQDQEPGKGMVQGATKGLVKGHGQLEPRLNGVGPCGSRRSEPEESGVTYGMIDPSLERLVHQLLSQNAALQQELVEARMYSGSGSGSTASGERRTEGRGLQGTGMGSSWTSS